MNEVLARNQQLLCDRIFNSDSIEQEIVCINHVPTLVFENSDCKTSIFFLNQIHHVLLNSGVPSSEDNYAIRRNLVQSNEAHRLGKQDPQLRPSGFPEHQLLNGCRHLVLRIEAANRN